MHTSIQQHRTRIKGKTLLAEPYIGSFGFKPSQSKIKTDFITPIVRTLLNTCNKFECFVERIELFLNPDTCGKNL